MKQIQFLIPFLFLSLCSFGQYDFDRPTGKIGTYLANDNSRFLGDTMLSFSGWGIDGKHYSKNDLKSKITFINFWFSACTPCINELGDLKKLYGKYSTNTNFRFISFTFDAVDLTKKTIGSYHLPYNVINLSDKECNDLNFGQGYPTNFIVDNTGHIVKISTGREIFKEQNYFENKIYLVLDSLLKFNK